MRGIGCGMAISAGLGMPEPGKGSGTMKIFATTMPQGAQDEGKDGDWKRAT